DWFDWADFKRTVKRSREDRERHLRAAIDTVKQRLRLRVELGVDAFETRSGRFTARLSSPLRTIGLGIRAPRQLKSQEIWVAADCVKNGRYGWEKRSQFWCFGAWRDFDRCRQFLLTSERARRLIERTHDGTLFSKAQGATERLEVGSAARALAEPV